MTRNLWDMRNCPICTALASGEAYAARLCGVYACGFVDALHGAMPLPGISLDEQTMPICEAHRAMLSTTVEGLMFVAEEEAKRRNAVRQQ